ncbi:MAG: hypothetical protein LBD35_07625 [Prevotellaceae bacterium]|nr:hypothetical protein [Prevotellaceae bacterium]
MKKLLIAAFMLVAASAAFSQKFEKKIAASDKSIADEKKSINPKTWIARGELFYEIAVAPANGLVAGMDETTYALTMGSAEKTESTETLNNKQYKVHTFPDKKVYFSNGVIVFWNVTQYEVPEPLRKAYDAYGKAKSLDAGGKNSKKIGANLKILSSLAKNEAFNSYQLGNYALSVDLFALSLDCSSDPLVGETDSLSYYYAGVIANEAGKLDLAEKFLTKAVQIGYTEHGDTYAALASVLEKADKKDQARSYLEKGIAGNPENQQLIIGLINNYMSSGRSPKDIIPLIKSAQDKEPTNASLYFAEGSLYEKLEDADNAVKCYEKSVQVDPSYFFGYYGIGIIYFNKAAKYDEQAMAEKDNKKYEELVTFADEQLKKALPYFEKSYELKNEENQKVVIQALKDINFRFRNENDTYKQNADKYSKMLELM